jgi:hypothetical protein
VPFCARNAVLGLKSAIFAKNAVFRLKCAIFAKNADFRLECHFPSLIYPAQKSSISASMHCLIGCPGIKNQGLIAIHCLFGCPGIKNNIPPVCTIPEMLRIPRFDLAKHR